MKWYSDWIQIFKTGEHTDSAGNTRFWSVEDLDAVIKNFANSEGVPVVLGHPKTDDPAYAWVSELKRDADTLYAKFDRVHPEFSKWVEKGLYRKISISLDDALNLRHVGFLGAVAPAVKGLKNNFSVFIPEKKGLNMFKNASKNEFQAKIDTLQKELEFAAKSAQQKDYQAVLDGLQKESKITAEDREHLSEVLKALYTGNLGQFSQGSDPAVSLFSFLQNLPKRCEFSELATKENMPVGTYRTPSEELGHKIAASLKG